MTDDLVHHRPLMAGMRIKTKTPGPAGIGDTENRWGTLTGWATRNSDNRDVLVTNLHVMAGLRGSLQPSGNEEMYQSDINNPEHKVGQIAANDSQNPAWVTISNRVDNVADVAVVELTDNVDEADITYVLHSPDHNMGVIVAGARDPESDCSARSHPMVGGKHIGPRMWNTSRGLYLHPARV